MHSEHQQHHVRPRRGRCAATAASLTLCGAGLLALTAAPAARAQADDPSPWWVGVQQEFSADTNLFRAPDGQPVSRDIVSSTSLLAGLDQPFGRQRFTADLNLGVNRYKNNTQLNGDSHALSARLDWATIERLSGQLSMFDRTNLFRYDLDRQQSFTGRTLLHSRGASLQARMGVVTEWSLEAGLAASDDSYSRPEFQYRDLRQAAANVGVRWQPSDLLSTRIGVRHTDGRYPHYALDNLGTVLPDEFKRDDIELAVRWAPNDKSQLRAQLNRTRERHELLGARNGDGWTGELAYDWHLTGKTALTLSAGRDSSVGASTFDDALIVQDNSDARHSTRVQAQLRYDATAKIQAQLDLQHLQRTLDDSFVLTPLASGGVPLAQGSTARDRLTAVNLRVRYQASRGLLFGCSIGRERRSTSDTSLTYPYGVTTGACFGQFLLR